MSQSNVYELIKKAKEINDEFERVHKHMTAMLERIQAAVDEVMLEYCPEEMTKEQLEEWRRCQVPVPAYYEVFEYMNRKVADEMKVFRKEDTR